MTVHVETNGKYEKSPAKGLVVYARYLYPRLM